MAQRGCARMSSEDESEIENMRLLETLTHENRSAKIYRDMAWDEYRVKFFENGAYCAEADSSPKFLRIENMKGID